MIEQNYSAGIMSQSFWFNEFRQLLKLRAENCDRDELKKRVIEENLFGAPNEYRAKRIYGYLINRTSAVEKELSDLFFSSDLATQKIINLIAVLRGDRLFFEFLYEVYRDKIILGVKTLELSDGRSFFNHKETQDDTVLAWKDQTKRRVQSAYYNFMTEANLLEIVDNKKLITPPILDIDLERYLKCNGETAIIKAITGEY